MSVVNIPTRSSATAAPSGAAGGSLAGTYPNPTVATSGVSASTFGSATQVAQVTFNTEGRATTAANVTITPTVLDPMTKLVVTEHFDCSNAVGLTGGVSSTNSGVITTSSAAEAGHPGIVTIGTSTSGTATPTWYRGSLQQYLGGSGLLSWDCVFKISHISDGTETFQIYLGFGNQTNGTEPTNGFYLTYTHSLNSGQFVFKSAAASSRTSLNISVAAAAATWYRAKMVLNTAGTSIDCYLSTSMQSLGASVGSISSNIPNSGSNYFGNQLTIAKSVGTTSRVLSVDMLEVVKEL